MQGLQTFNLTNI